jgi:ABC-type lipoprotein export system ATPase subunit
VDVTVAGQLRRRTIGGATLAAETGDLLFELTDVIHVYREADVETIALRGVDLEVARGEFVAVMGRSGSGKSTLLNLLAGSDRPTAGSLRFRGRDLAALDETARARLRGRDIGVVYQRQNLLPMLSLIENMRLAAWLADRPIDDQKARDALRQVGLDERADHRPDALSGGEQQRAALSCVTAAGPAVVLADEITGELDSRSARQVLALLRDVHARGCAVVLVTHDPDVAAIADRLITLADGRVLDDRRLT